MSTSHWGLMVGLARPHRRAFAGYGILLAAATALPVVGTILIARFVDLVVALARADQVIDLGARR